MFGIYIKELLIILVIVLIIFAAWKLPEISSALGKGRKKFQKSINENNEITNQLSKKEDKKNNYYCAIKAILWFVIFNAMPHLFYFKIHLKNCFE
ncbi:MAG: twin-arginine translocase TatA/TatE family subunit [Smithella sp.]